MKNKKEKTEGKIYLMVGFEGRIDDFSLDTSPDSLYKDRKVIKAKRNAGFVRDIILAVYKDTEIKKSDLKVIRGHKSFDAIYRKKNIKYYGFTHNHFLETIKHRKNGMLAEKGILKQDDDTIFGKVSTYITIKERIIPEHKKEIYVEWDDWEDSFTTDEEYEVCDCQSYD